MKKLYAIFIVTLLFKYGYQAQNISGIVNHYAAVKNISGASLSVSNATAFNTGDKLLLIQMKGATVDQTNANTFGDITSMGGAGTFEFLNVSSVNGTVITTGTSPVNTYNTATGWVQVVRVPKFCTPTVTSLLSCAAWNPTTGVGGILALEANTITLNANIDVSDKGFKGGVFTVGSYSCDNGNFAAPSNSQQGGKKGESISAYVTGLDGLKGKQANGGGASNSGNSGGAGGGNAGAGGFGGNQYTECDPNVDERGIGGLSLNMSLTRLFSGGGGGGGFRDNGLTASNGGNGGGIIYLHANTIVANNHAILANGGDVTVIADAEGSGGGGAGGSIFLECSSVTGNLLVETNGGNGGSNNNSMFVINCHGPGGGGGGGVFALSYANIPGNITYNCDGGNAGTVSNSVSSCFGTTYGAADGADGDTLYNLPVTPVTLLAGNAVSILTADTTICRGGTANIAAGGSLYHNWSSATTTSATSVSPTITTVYTVTGSDGDNFCQSSASTKVTVAPCYENVNEWSEQIVLNVFPNPTNGLVFVETASACVLTLSDISGQTLVKLNTNGGVQSINLRSYPAGIYFLKTEIKTGSKTTKLVKTD